MTQREPRSDRDGVTSELKGDSSDSSGKLSGDNSVNGKLSGDSSVVVEPYTVDELQVRFVWLSKDSFGKLI